MVPKRGTKSPSNVAGPKQPVSKEDKFKSLRQEWSKKQPDPKVKAGGKKGKALAALVQLVKPPITDEEVAMEALELMDDYEYRPHDSIEPSNALGSSDYDESAMLSLSLE
jgi:hypothetical protein